MKPTISKSHYLAGLQCLKRLWLEKSRPDLVSPPTPDQQHRFDQGQEVGELAHRLYPEGILLDEELDFERHLAKSKDALVHHRPLFEPAFSIPSAYSRADILVPSENGAWDVVEVKSAGNVWEDDKKTRFDPVYLNDIAFQLYVYERAGLKINRCFLLFVSSEYVRQGGIDPTKLFRKEDVTTEVRAMLHEVPRNIESLLVSLASVEPPAIAIGRHCNNPYDCPLIARCWADVPENSVHTLYRCTKKHELWNQGYRTLLEIPANFKLTDRQKIQVACEKTGQPHFDRKEIATFLRGFQFPLHFLDFESFALAIPPYDGCWPYLQVSFQFSLHILSKPDGELIHHEFLASGADDPRPLLLKSLSGALGNAGSIVSFNAAFEKSRMNEMAEAFPEHAMWIKATAQRFEGVDLLKPFRDFSFYHPKQRGSASIKNVLPALTKVDYSDLAIGDGSIAGSEFLRIAFKQPDAPDAQTVRQNLKLYCARDTMAMVEIYKELCQMVS